MNPKIIFLKVLTNQEKLFSLTKTIQKHFDLGDQLLILCPNIQVANYIDQLIWRLPEDSFIPHSIVNEMCHEKVAITYQNENFNKAGILINLCKEIPSLPLGFQLVYDLFDQTDADRHALSKARFSSYQVAGLQPTL
jgi:DNA polymerase-3 subunit chi